MNPKLSPIPLRIQTRAVLLDHENQPLASGHATRLETEVYMWDSDHPGNVGMLIASAKFVQFPYSKAFPITNLKTHEGVPLMHLHFELA